MRSYQYPCKRSFKTAGIRPNQWCRNKNVKRFLAHPTNGKIFFGSPVNVVAVAFTIYFELMFH